MDDLRKAVFRYLERHNTMTLATTSEGLPWASAVFYVSEGLTLYFVSSPESRHAQNIRSNPRVAAAIHKDYDDWRTIKGIQLEGEAEEVPSDALRDVLSVYLQKFPFVRDFVREDGFQIAGKRIAARFYRVLAERILYLDNEAAFGVRRELMRQGNGWLERS